MKTIFAAIRGHPEYAQVEVNTIIGTPVNVRISAVAQGYMGIRKAA